MIIPPQVKKLIEDSDRFWIVGHTEPDGDCIGSQLALAGFLKRIGKSARLLSPGPFKRPEIAEYEQLFLQSTGLDITEGVLVIVDCSTLERIDRFSTLAERLGTLVIDHHASGDPFGDFRLVDPASPSTTLIVQDIIEQLGYVPTKEEAELLLFGFCTDTGFFRHLESGTASVFLAVSRLVEAGASPKNAHAHMYGGRTIGSRMLLGTILSRAQVHFGGKFILSYETLEDLNAYGMESRDSDTLYQLLVSVQGVQAVALVREETDTVCSVGLRAPGDLDVGAIAKRFSGGGHRKAAGFQFTGSRKEVIDLLINTFEIEFSI